MRIGFDVRPVFRKNSRRRGIGKYTGQLIRHLLEINQDHSFILYTLSGESLCFPGTDESRSIFQLNRPQRLNWLVDACLLPGRIRQDKIDLFHATDITSIPNRSTAQVWVTVHDLIPLVFWEKTVTTVPRDYRYALQRAWRQLSRIDQIVTDSSHSKKDICERLNVPPGNVHVVYPGGNENFGPLDLELATDRLSADYGISPPFLFYVGGSDFRKNLDRLIEAFSQIRKLGFEGKLVMAGETFRWNILETASIREKVAKLGLEDWVEFPGYIPDDDLPLFYSACEMFIFPSLYEGFGFPVLEAMQCGTPVLAGRVSSIPEVAGEAAAYFEPSEVEDMVSAFDRVYGDPETLKEMRQKGFEQARRFDWRQTARKLLQLYGEYGPG